jgi:hypothetical protein
MKSNNKFPSLELSEETTIRKNPGSCLFQAENELLGRPKFLRKVNSAESNPKISNVPLLVPVYFGKINREIGAINDGQKQLTNAWLDGSEKKYLQIGNRILIKDRYCHPIAFSRF